VTSGHCSHKRERGRGKEKKGKQTKHFYMSNEETGNLGLLPSMETKKLGK
jgi:hypothetical protein